MARGEGVRLSERHRPSDDDAGETLVGLLDAAQMVNARPAELRLRLGAEQFVQIGGWELELRQTRPAVVAVRRLRW